MDQNRDNGLDGLILLGLLLCGLATSVAASVKTFYASEPIASEHLGVPISSFHDWQEANREARTITKAWKQASASLALTQLQLVLHVKHKTMPTRGARGLALTHLAMHDAYVLAKQGGLDARLSMLMAHMTVLSYLYPAEEKAFDRIAFSVAAQQSDTSPTALRTASIAALKFGKSIGQLFIARAERDGAQRGWNGSQLQWYGQDRYFAPGAWQPTPPYFYYPPDEPFAPSWKTWLIPSAQMFRRAPLAFGSKAYLQELGEVLRIRHTLTPEQMAIAKYWVDGHGSATPPGHWNQIAATEAVQAQLSEAETIALFAELNLAMADCFIAIWDTKYAYWTARPISVAEPLTGVAFIPLLLTPPFPSFPSGHAGFSSAAARIIGDYIPARKTALEAMADEAAMSRLLGGVHFRHDNEAGIQIGFQVGNYVLKHSPIRPKTYFTPSSTASSSTSPIVPE